MRAPLIALFGPTTAGKTEVAVALAERIDGEIVSADSMQVYRGLEGLTNQPTETERRGIPHHLVGIVDPDEPFDVTRYGALAHAAIDAIRARGRTPIVAGGSGLYLRAALVALDPPPAAPPALRRRIEQEVDDLGPAEAHARLQSVDPAAARRIPAGDTRRIVRALELHALGASLVPAGEDRLWDGTMRVPTVLTTLVVPRPELHRRIDARTPLLVERGIPEVEALRTRASGLSETARRAHGVEDILALLEGRIDRARCVERLAARTRQYAKRQDTWRRRLPGAHGVDGEQAPEAIAATILRLAA